MNGRAFAWFFPALIALKLLSAWHKDIPNPPYSYSGDVIEKWMTMQVRLMRNATGIPNQAFSRHYAYTGIAALESIAPGLPEYKKWSKKWNGLTGLPQPDHSKKYYWPANINSALARMNKSLFPNASVADKAAIDSLENALHQTFLNSDGASMVPASVQFGEAVANAVYNWSETDGYKNASNPYTPRVGDGLWIPTPPAFAIAATPYWGNNRPVVKGSITNTQPAAPISYSAEPNTPFYNMVKEVYDASQNLTEDQKNMAMYWRDIPGVSSPGHWLSILQQVTVQTDASLAKAALAYALTGAAISDGLISCWKTKYHYNLIRPVSYIRNVMGHTNWNPHLPTPSHPEYSSAHAVLSVAAAEVFEKVFGNINSFTDHTYDYLGFPSRTYSSFTAIGLEAGKSRFYGGIHYLPCIAIGSEQGKKVAANILKQ
jgi:hypothetical protein